MIYNGWYDVFAPVNGVASINSLGGNYVWHNIFQLNSGDIHFCTQLAFDMTTGKSQMYMRTRSNNNWTGWYTMYHTGNLNNSSTDFTAKNLSVYGKVGIGAPTIPTSMLEVHGTTSIGQFTNGTAVIDAFNSYAYFGCNSATNGIAVGPTGTVGIGTSDTGGETFKIYKSDLPTFGIGSSVSHLQIGMATCDNCFATGAISGNTVIRTLGVTNSTLLYVPNIINDGKSYIGFGDGANGIWMKVLNNRTLRIDGKVYATEILVQTNVWADNVFNKGYKLRSLAETEAYIKANNHLPEVPTEAEIKDKGINVANMNALLLQKVEELTLYIIEKDKQFVAQEKKNTDMEQQIKELRELILTK